MAQGVFRDLTGERIGDWTVLRRAPTRLMPSGQTRTMWLCRCVCGAVHEVHAPSLASGASRRCMVCMCRRNAEWQRRAASRRVAGTTIALIAERAGLPLDTVYHRWCRGWPLERLGAPIAEKYMRRPETAARLRGEP